MDQFRTLKKLKLDTATDANQPLALVFNLQEQNYSLSIYDSLFNSKNQHILTTGFYRYINTGYLASGDIASVYYNGFTAAKENIYDLCGPVGGQIIKLV